jgi:hypothetical protein
MYIVMKLYIDPVIVVYLVFLWVVCLNHDLVEGMNPSNCDTVSTFVNTLQDLHESKCADDGTSLSPVICNGINTLQDFYGKEYIHYCMGAPESTGPAGSTGSASLLTCNQYLTLSNAGNCAKCITYNSGTEPVVGSDSQQMIGDICPERCSDICRDHEPGGDMTYEDKPWYIPVPLDPLDPGSPVVPPVVPPGPEHQYCTDPALPSTASTCIPVLPDEWPSTANFQVSEDGLSSGCTSPDENCWLPPAPLGMRSTYGSRAPMISGIGHCMIRSYLAGPMNINIPLSDCERYADIGFCHGDPSITSLEECEGSLEGS